ncbi:MAG: restriction endonuclease subunit S, partial [Nanoarchaeota archaeon]|nr:restriction endonuclease subunit S [Nanoarchaeota archaeon]
MNLEKSNWEIKQIGETCELIKEVYQPKKTESLPYIGLEHINQQILSINAIGNSGDVDSLKFKFKKGQVLFGKLRPYFRKVYLPNFDGICSTDIWVINARKGFYNPYLFYFFASKEIVDRITKSSEGTRMPRGKWNYLENLEYPFPPFNGQQAIANILLKLDEKIELNNQMNQTLETMGKVLFKEWFIDGKKKEWKTSTIGEELKTVLGGTPSRLKTEYWGGDINWINSGKVNEFRIVEPSEKITEEGLKKSATTLLLKGSVVIAITGATLGQVSRLEIDSCANQS